MKIVWSDFSIEMLLEIYSYYKKKASPSIAKKIKTEILTATNQLKKHPTSGQIEMNLEMLNEGHRYLVKGNYKITYKEIPEGLLITDVFDTRQDPIKINDEKREPS
ncbi:type II toxin-antitoxin system RelE/ParE family toxin [Natronoflexus pectinivorans]|uniref:Plasmid stabilization system protein ParE n=1 Tax=Natronoflexus pectinivorans TaxID=682526 RepID=A0A4R2GLG4_9BACT|nr:type II toxin-antitoxin system RelE/ParE family toxin [Natronoflexus pectinivorans]TCO09825.1 plasmid stabilization system protein ParE [Natronoflexus pectinivorans]